MEILLRELVGCLWPFAIEVTLIMFITNTYESKPTHSCLKRTWNSIKECFQFNAFQKSRLKGLLIIVIGIVAGIYMQYLSVPQTSTVNASPTLKLIVDGMVQMAYMFATAVAAVYITHGYELNQKEKIKQEEQAKIQSRSAQDDDLIVF